MKRIAGMVLFFKNSEAFSNWYPAKFTVDGVAFSSSEQYMMHAKAMLFGDTAMAARILATDSPKDQKALGRQVAGFVYEVWMAECRPLMVRGLLAKFEQNPDMGQVLLDTDDDILVEASPFDRIWGVGLSQNDPRILDQAAWPGLNYQGEVLMSARSLLRVKLGQPV